MRYIPIILTLLISLNVYSQVNVLEVDTSKTELTIINNGTLINNQGTVNIGEGESNEELKLDKDLGHVSNSKDSNIHFIYTDNYEFAKDKVKIKGNVYYNDGIPKSMYGKQIFKVTGNKASAYYGTQRDIYIRDFHHYVEGNILYISRYRNCKDEYVAYYIPDGTRYSGEYVIKVEGQVIISNQSETPWNDLDGCTTKWIEAAIIIGFILLIISCVTSVRN